MVGVLIFLQLAKSLAVVLCKQIVSFNAILSLRLFFYIYFLLINFALMPNQLVTQVYGDRLGAADLYADDSFFLRRESS